MTISYILFERWSGFRLRFFVGRWNHYIFPMTDYLSLFENVDFEKSCPSLNWKKIDGNRTLLQEFLTKKVLCEGININKMLNLTK